MNAVMGSLSASSVVVIDEPIEVNQQGIVAPWAEDSMDGISPQDQLVLNEVLIKSDGVLVLPPFASIVIKKLISEDGGRIQIAHSASGHDAAPGVDGGHGARVRFFVKTLRGHIILESRGGRGGDGRDGRYGRQGQDGEPGRDARTLIAGLIYLGNGEAGRAGYPGEDGESGERGGSGGDGGRVSLYFSEKSMDSKILIDVAGGDAGIGGRAGIGGLGGNGGPGGEGIKPGAQGPMGKRGQSGKPGMPGQPGRPGTSGIYQVSSEMFECLLILDALHLSGNLTETDYDRCESLDRGSQIVQHKQIRERPSTAQLALAQDAIVYIQADGKNGKSSSRSRQYGETPPPASSGSAGGAVTVFLTDIPQQLFLSARGGNGGHGANGALGRRGRDGLPGRDAQPFRPARPGAPGEDGGAGGHGSSGGNGGDGGRIKLVLLAPASSADLDELIQNWSLDVSSGSGGRGGEGGEGGRGGAGGRGGKSAPPKLPEPDGKPGLNGERGLRGTAGSAGQFGEVEILSVSSMEAFILEEFRRDLD